MKKFILLTLFLYLLILPFKTYAENNNNNEIDLTTDPGKVLFDLSNVKPGDSVYRNLLITNNGTQDFNYLASSKFISGSEILFDKLDLVIKANNKTLFKGKLFEFEKLAPRLLKSRQNENLLLYIKVPEELGNEFQGLTSDFQFKFYVEGTLGGVIPADGPKLPDTGSNMFNLLVSGCVLFLIGISLQLFVKFKRRISNQE